MTERGSDEFKGISNRNKKFSPLVILSLYIIIYGALNLSHKEYKSYMWKYVIIDIIYFQDIQAYKLKATELS